MRKIICIVIALILLVLLILPSFTLALPLMGAEQTSRHAIILADNSHGSCKIWATTCGRLMKNVLREYGWSNKEITLLFNSKATTENFAKEIERVKDYDEVIVCFFGHGSFNYVALHRVGIWHYEIRDIMENLSADKQLLIIDTCKSGGAILPGRDGITVCAPNRLVLTSTWSEIGSSVYTGHITDWCYAVLKWGLLEGNADFNEDGKVSVEEAGSVKGGISDEYEGDFLL